MKFAPELAVVIGVSPVEFVPPPEGNGGDVLFDGEGGGD